MKQQNNLRISSLLRYSQTLHLCMGTLFTLAISLRAEVPVNVPAGTTLVWSDEFEVEGAPNPNKWSFDVDGNEWAWGNNELQNYTPANHPQPNAWVEDGKLIIEARKESFTHSGFTREYTSARLRTVNKGDWLYGRFDIRAKLPAGRGTWAAIWMLPTDWEYGGWPDSGEIDIMEHVGYDMNRVHATVHTGKFNHSIGTQVGDSIVVPSVDEQFHVYRLDWTPERIDVYLNDIHYFSFPNDGGDSGSWPFDKRFHLLLNLAIGGNWGGSEGVDDSIFPQRMEVDYVRVYAYDDPSAMPVHPVPGRISAAAFSDQQGSLDVETDSAERNGLHLASIEDGDAVSYTLDVPSTGSYSLSLRYASEQAGVAVKVWVNGAEAGNVNLPQTAEGVWRSAIVGPLSLEQGRTELRLQFEVPQGSGVQLRWLDWISDESVVQRFYQPATGAYFFTAFRDELEQVILNLPQWRYEGPTFGVEYAPSEYNTPVYRFYNQRAGAHFYTASASERDTVIANLSHQYVYEGVAFYVRTQSVGPDPVTLQQREFFPVWRCYLPRTASHYFTSNASEVEYIRRHVDASEMFVEGIAWYTHRVS